MARVGMQVSTTIGVINIGDQHFFARAQTPWLLKPGMTVCIDNEYTQVSSTYTGLNNEGNPIPIDGQFAYPHLSGAFCQWDGNLEPGLTGT